MWLPLRPHRQPALGQRPTQVVGLPTSVSDRPSDVRGRATQGDGPIRWKLTALALLAGAAITAPSAQAHVASCDRSPSGYTLCAIHKYCNRVWRIEGALGAPRTKYGWTADRRRASTSYRLWVRHLWYARWKHWLRVNRILYVPPGIRAGLLCLHPKESADWHRNGGMGPQVSGGLQIALSTWIANDGLRFAPAAYLATPHEQMRVGANIVESSGWGPWPLTARACGLL